MRIKVIYFLMQPNLSQNTSLTFLNDSTMAFLSQDDLPWSENDQLSSNKSFLPKTRLPDLKHILPVLGMPNVPRHTLPAQVYPFWANHVLPASSPSCPLSMSPGHRCFTGHVRSASSIQACPLGPGTISRKVFHVGFISSVGTSSTVQWR